jgi:hypothetical protein
MTSPTTPKTTARKKPTASRAKAGPTTARVELMRREALQLVNKGYSCPQIGEVLGVSRQRAHQLVSEELGLLAAETLDEAAQWRNKLTARHEARLKALDEATTRVTDPAALISAIDKAKSIDIELGKLWGAYAPARSELSGPNGGPIETNGVFAVPTGTVDGEAWTAAALVQSAGEEAEAERVLGKPKAGAAGETAPAA